MGLPEIRTDLAQHVIYGYGAAALACAGLAVASLVLEMPGLRVAMPGAAVAGGLVAGVAKEAADWLANRRHVRDWSKPMPLPHEVSWADVVATVLGAVPCAVVALLRAC